MPTTKAIVFFTRTELGASSNDPTRNGINNDGVNLDSETSTHVLIDGNSSSYFVPAANTPVTVTFNAALHTYYTYLTATQGSTFYGSIYSGDTSTGALGSVLYSPLTTSQINNYYTGFVNDIVDDPVNHKLYFTQQVLDPDLDIVAGQTGIYVMNESGGTATRLPINGLTQPNVLAIDTLNNLVFFTDSTEYGYLGGQTTYRERLDVANLTTGAVSVLVNEPFVNDAYYGTGENGGKLLNGIAIDPISHTLVFTTNNPYNSPTDSGIFKTTYTVTGTGATAAATIGSITTLYSGTNSFDPSAIVLDVADGIFYVSGNTPQALGGGVYNAVNAGIYEGSLTATNTTALTRVTPLSETAGDSTYPQGQQINDIAIDIAPIVTAGASVTWEVGNAAIAVDSTLAISAQTSPNFVSATVVIGSPQTGDTLAAVTTGTSITASYGGGTLTLSGTDTAAHYQQVLDSVAYSSSNADPTIGSTVPSRTLTYALYDGIISSAAVTSTVSVRVRPTVTAGATVTFTGGGGPVTADAALTLSDASTATLTGATISITTGHLSGDTLGFTAQNGISGAFNGTTGVLTLSGTATLAQYQTAIDGITFGFSPSNADPTNGGASTSRTISYTVTDGVGTSLPATSTVTVTHAAPSVVAGANPTYVTGGPSVAIDPALTITAPDSSGLIASATVTIAINHNAADTLAFTNQNGITGSFNSTTGVLSLTGSATVAQYQSAIESITFSSTNTSSTSTRGVSYTVNDGTATSSAATSTVTVNHPTPGIAGAVAGQAVSDEATIAPFAGVTITDSANQQDSATITVTASGVPTDADGTLAGTGLTKTGVGTYTLAATTPAALTSALAALVFTPAAHQVPAGSTVTTGFTLAIADSGGGSATNATTTVIATATTDTPTISGTVADQPTTDLVPVNPFATVSIADPDDAVTPTVTITLRSGGVATDANGILSGAGLTKTGVGTYTLTDTPANLTTELQALTFTPTHDQVPVGQIVSTAFDLLVAVGGVSASDTTTSVNATDVPCYCRGTLILTERGEVPVEALVIGDRVATIGGALEPIRWIGRRSYAGAFAATNPNVWPVLFRQGALADGIPRRDLFVSPEHAMFVAGVLVPARHLVNGSSIVVTDRYESIDYYHVELDAHGVIYAEGATAETFVDCNSRGMFHNAAEFSALYPGTAPDAWRFCAPVVEAGSALAAIQAQLLQHAQKIGYGVAQDGPLLGNLDVAHRGAIAGWAALDDHPGTSVRLEILDNGTTIATLVANIYRADLEAAGIGDGRHSFDLRLTKPLDPFTRHEITVRRAQDGQTLRGSPIVVEAALSVDTTVRQNLAGLLSEAALRAASVAELDSVLEILDDHVVPLQRARARLMDQTTSADRRRGGSVAAQRALVIDETWPHPDRDAGSQAVLSHMQGLQRLGWDVTFIPTTVASRDPAAVATLQALGIACHTAPIFSSVEQVLRSTADTYELVYLHRWQIASAYVGLVRQHQPRARCVYSVADLHHLRLSRQAAVEARPELLRAAQAVRRQELLAMGQVDAVITHSTAEAAILARELPGAPVHVVPWDVRSLGPTAPWPARNGVVFVANFAHTPNRDALDWLIEAVMPSVWAEAPSIGLTVAGVDLPPGLQRGTTDARIQIRGFVPDLSALYSTARLAVAPLRFGAGLKGKVLEAWAAGLPCAMTPIAAEGFALGADIAATVTADPVALARLIVALHDQESLNARHAQSGRALLWHHFSEEQVTASLGAVVSPETVQPVAIARRA